MDDLLTATYSTRDAAVALDAPTFSDLRRNLSKGGFLSVPREAGPGGAGGNYKFGHLFELALFLSLTPAHSREAAKCILVAGLQALRTRSHDKLNALPERERRRVMFGTDDFDFTRADDPHELFQFAQFPGVMLGTDMVPRDPAAPLYWMFLAQSHGRPAPLIEVRDPTDLATAHARLTASYTRSAINDRTREGMEEEAASASIINVTDVVNRLERRLAYRLEARAPISKGSTE